MIWYHLNLYKCIPISILFIDFIWAASKNYWTFPNKVDYWGFLVPVKTTIYRGVVDYKNARLQQTKDTFFCYIPLSLQYFQMIPPSVHVWWDIFIHFPPCCDIKLALGDAAPSWFWALRCIVLPSDGSRMLDNSLNSLRKTRLALRLEARQVHFCLIRLASWLFNARCLPGNVRACGVVHQSYRRHHTKKTNSHVS